MILYKYGRLSNASVPKYYLPILSFPSNKK